MLHQVIYSIEPRTRKSVKWYTFLSFARNVSRKYRKQLLDREINASKKVIHKASEATRKCLENKIADRIVKTKAVKELVIPPEKSEEILNYLRIVL